MSVRNDGISTIENGIYKNMPLSEYLNLREEEFPLLVKFIDARDKLSIQVHPNKFEVWYIVEAEPCAQIVYGVDKKVFSYINVKPGEIYEIPTGLVHAIGAGILIAEVQQNDNTTYRLYDYDRGRELQVEQALAAIKHDFEPNNYFTVNVHEVDVVIDASETFKHILCIGGNGFIGNYEINFGDSYFIPQGLECKIRGVKILESFKSY